MIEKAIDTTKLMAIGFGGYVISLLFGKNVITENHKEINNWLQTFVLLITAAGVIAQFLWNLKKRKNESRSKNKS